MVRLRVVLLSSLFCCLFRPCSAVEEAHPSPASQVIQTAAYRVLISEDSAGIQAGHPPRLTLEQEGEPVFEMPVVSGLSSVTAEERLSNVRWSIKQIGAVSWELNATADSSLWTGRRFVWRFLSDHIEFQQFASGHGKLGRCYFASNGLSERWAAGTAGGREWDTTVFADRYFSPAPNHANQFEFNIAMPQTLGFARDGKQGSEADFRPERMNGLFQPPPLFLAFHQKKTWTGVGIGATPGEYRFPAFEYSGSRYAGASFYVDYLGYRALDGDFASPVLSFTFAYDRLDALRGYSNWLETSGFSTKSSSQNVPWHRLPIFCGWAEQTVESVPFNKAPNALATQANYERWLSILEQRGLPIGTIVIDDKWQKAYGTFEVDTAKWPDLKGFISSQHAKGRHVLLWVPVAHPEGLPADLCISVDGKCAGADVGKPEYDSFLRPRIRHLVADLGVDGFKEDWVDAPSVAGLNVTPTVVGLEFVRRFQWILYDETHKTKPDALVETQTVNGLFHESSDVIRLNDIWYGTREVPDVLRLRASIAHIAGWPLVDTDNASSTTLRDWWSYMQAQPSIGIPALYFVSRTESTQEAPTQAQWDALAGLWRDYIAKLKAEGSAP